MLTAFLYDPIRRLHQLNQLVQAGRAAGERVFEILDEPAEQGFVADIGLSAVVSAKADDHGQVRIVGDIRYHNVSFSYAEGLPALKRVYLHAPPGATISLSGGNRRWEIDTGEFTCSIL